MLAGSYPVGKGSMSLVAKLPADESSKAKSLIPLCVDLDGTLIRTDLLFESLLLLLRQNFLYLFCVPFWVMAGKAALKQHLAQRVSFDPAAIPYNKDLLEWIRQQKLLGRHTVLATASNCALAAKVSTYLGCFDEVLGSDNSINLSGDTKRAALVARFGERGFDYVGNSHKDLSIWARCNACIVVHASKPTLQRAQKAGPVGRVFPKPATKLKTWLRAVRVHQRSEEHTSEL